MKLFKAMLCSVAALSLLLPAAHAQAAPTVVKIALTQPTGHPTTDLIRGQFKKTIEEKTNGRFRIDVFDNYSFGNFEAVVQGLQFGMLQFAQESPSNLSIYDPKLMIFDLPYLMPDYDAVNILLDGKVGEGTEPLPRKDRHQGHGLDRPRHPFLLDEQAIPHHGRSQVHEDPRHRFQGSYQYDQGLRHEPHPHGLE